MYLRSLHEYTYKIQWQKSTNIATIRWLNKLPAYYTGVSVVKGSNLGGSESRDEQRRHSFPVSYILHGHSCAPEITRIFDSRLGINKDAIVKRAVNMNLIIFYSFNNYIIIKDIISKFYLNICYCHMIRYLTIILYIFSLRIKNVKYKWNNI